MQFEKVLQLARSTDSINVPGDWAQGRSVFGGIAAAIGYEKALGSLNNGDSESDRPIRSLFVSFVGPLDTEKSLALSGEVIRAGKSVAQVESRIHQDDQTKLVMLAAYGAPRESAIEVLPERPPEVQAPELCKELPYFEGVTPAFTQHYHYRFNWGGFPFSGNQSRQMGGWVKYRQPEPVISISHILGLLDSWPPAVLPMLSKPSPGSSLTWMVDFVHPAPMVRPDEWVLYHSEVQEAANGYAMIDSRMWNEAGELLVIGRQCVTVFG